jgi:hypothetical protein
MSQFLGEMASAVGIPVENTACTDGVTIQIRSNETKRGHKLMTEELRKQLPSLYAQENKGGKAMVYAKYFCGSWTWYALEYNGASALLPASLVGFLAVFVIAFHLINIRAGPGCCFSG